MAHTRIAFLSSTGTDLTEYVAPTSQVSGKSGPPAVAEGAGFPDPKGPLARTLLVAERMLHRIWFEQPYGAKVANCHTGAGLPGLWLLVIVAPFMSQM